MRTCKWCGTREDADNEHSYCHMRSLAEGNTYAHEWKEDDGIRMECSYCGVSETPENEFDLCQQHSAEEGGMCMHRWVVSADASWFEEPKPLLTEDSAARKRMPIYSGVIRYFPDALAYIAEISFDGNEKHNPGEPLHWSRGKSDDHLDCVARHLVDAGTKDSEGHRHSGMLAWRALANLQLELEEAKKRNAN